MQCVPNIVESVYKWRFHIIIILAGLIVYGKCVTYGLTYVDDVSLK